jgi:hypothetical protein
MEARKEKNEQSDEKEREISKKTEEKQDKTKADLM